MLRKSTYTEAAPPDPSAIVACSSSGSSCKPLALFPHLQTWDLPLLQRLGQEYLSRSVTVQSVGQNQLSTSSSQWRSEQQRPEFALSTRSCEFLDGWTNSRQMVG